MKTSRPYYFFGGINGVGKSKLITTIREAYPLMELFKGSAMLMYRLGLQEGDYEGLRGLPDVFKEGEVDRMMEEVLTAESQTTAPLLIDAHLINYKRGELRDATGPWFRHLTALFIVDAPAANILQRAKDDEAAGRKHRDMLPSGLTEQEELAYIQSYQAATFIKANEVGSAYRIPTFTINNGDAEIEHALRQFEEFHRIISGGESFLPKLK